MRFKAGKYKRFNQYRKGGKMLMRLNNFDAFLQSKKIIYGLAF